MEKILRKCHEEIGIQFVKLQVQKTPDVEVI